MSTWSIPLITAAYFNCDYVMPITVVNSSVSTVTNARIQFELNPDTLIGLGMIKTAEADDTYLQNGGTTLEHVALGLDTNSVTWTGLLPSLSGYGQASLDLFMGELNPGTRNQSWIGQYNDYTWAYDDNTLDLATGFQLSCDITLLSIPNSGSPNQDIISKAGNYELVVQGTTGGTAEYVFTVWSGTGADISPATGTPAARGYYTDMLLTSDSSKPHWYLVGSPNDTTWVGLSTSGSDSISASDSFPTNITYGSEITIAATTVYYRVGLNSGTGVSEAIPFLYSGPTGLVWGTTQTVPSAFITYSDAIPYSGGTDFEVGIRFLWASGSKPRCSRLYGTTDIQEPGTKTSVALAAIVDTEVSLKGWYGGANIVIDDGTVQVISGTVTGSCYQNSNPVHLLEVDALMDNPSISVD